MHALRARSVGSRRATVAGAKGRASEACGWGQHVPWVRDGVVRSGLEGDEREKSSSPRHRATSFFSKAKCARNFVLNRSVNHSFFPFFLSEIFLSSSLSPFLPRSFEGKRGRARERERAMSSSRFLAPLLLARRLGASTQQQQTGSWLAGVGGEMIVVVGGLFPTSMIAPSFLPPAACAALGQVRWYVKLRCPASPRGRIVTRRCAPAAPFALSRDRKNDALDQRKRRYLVSVSSSPPHSPRSPTPHSCPSQLRTHAPNQHQSTKKQRHEEAGRLHQQQGQPAPEDAWRQARRRRASEGGRDRREAARDEGAPGPRSRHGEDIYRWCFAVSRRERAREGEGMGKRREKEKRAAPGGRDLTPKTKKKPSKLETGPGPHPLRAGRRSRLVRVGPPGTEAERADRRGRGLNCCWWWWRWGKERT